MLKTQTKASLCKRNNVKKANKMIDLTLLKTLRAEIDAAMIEIGAKHGLKIALGNAKYTKANAEFKLNVANIADDGLVETKEMVALKLQYPELVNKIVLVSGKEYQIVGYRTKSPKKPFLAKEVKSGKLWVLSPQHLVNI